MDIAVIADEDTLLGFKLAGVKNGEVFSEEKVNELVEKFKEAKILIITEKVAKFLREKKLMEKITSVIAEIPDKSGSTGHAFKEISKLFESAIGVQLKEDAGE